MFNTLISSASLWANQVSALSAQRALLPNAVMAPGGASPGISAATASSRGQIAQDLQSFTQSLQQALVSNQPAPTQSGAATGVTSPGGSGATPASSVPHGHAHHHGGERGKLQSLIDTLNGSANSSASTASSSSSAGNSLVSLNASFNKLMADLGASAGTAASSAIPAAASATGAALGQHASAPLQGLLQGMLQHLQQQGTRAAALGQGLHVVA